MKTNQVFRSSIDGVSLKITSSFEIQTFQENANQAGWTGEHGLVGLTLNFSETLHHEKDSC